MSVPHYDVIVAAAWLHDTVEDTATTSGEVEELFGFLVAGLVWQVTDISNPEDGKRAVRTGIYREHLRKAPFDAKKIKLADVIDNGSSIVEHEKNFPQVYLAEKEALLEVLDDGHPILSAQAYEILRQSQRVLVQAALEQAENGMVLCNWSE